MSRYLDPPRLADAISDIKRRLFALERRQAPEVPRVPGYTARWSMCGPLVTSTSGIDVHPTGGRLVRLYGVLVEAGDEASVIDLLLNGQPVAVLTFAAGQRHAEQTVSVQVPARYGELQVACSVAGAGAEGVTVFAEFDR